MSRLVHIHIDNIFESWKNAKNRFGVIETFIFYKFLDYKNPMRRKRIKNGDEWWFFDGHSTYHSLFMRD